MKVQQFIDWLVVNWQFVSSAAISIVTFILLLIFKRRPSIIDNSQYKDILVLINEAEKKFGSGHGEEKLNYVLDTYLNFKGLERSYWNISSVKHLIEYILSSPQKKGGN